MKEALLVSYMHERREEEAGRLTGKFEYRPKRTSGHRMTSFGASGYGRHKVRRLDIPSGVRTKMKGRRNSQ